MKNRIYFFANFGDWNKLPNGGGEVGNRKTLELFRQMDVDVVLIPKYEHVINHTAWTKVVVFFRMIRCLLNFTLTLLFGRRSHSIVHVSGFYGNVIYFENVLVRIAKVLGYHVVYEMRGGGAEGYYAEGTPEYRKAFSETIRKCDMVFSQGMENKPLIDNISKGKAFFYYPNYVMEGFYPKECPEKPKDRLNLVFFGRLTRWKHIDVIVDTFFQLAERYGNVYLDIIGDTADSGYINPIKEKIQTSRYSAHVHFHPACNHEELKKHLADKHIFLFPTTTKREGHSNALTEAMSWGCVPITNKHGFSRTVVGDDHLIADSIDVKNFIFVIDSLIESDSLDRYSKYSYNRVMTLYTDSIALQNITDVYNEMFRTLI